MTEKNISLLLIEDDDVDREALKRHIKKENLPYDVQTAATEEEVRKILQESVFDIVLLDYDLGPATGLDILPQIGNIPVVFVTGRGSEEIAVNAMKAGAFDYLIKDAELNYLKVLPLTIQNVMSRKRAEEERDELINELKEALDQVKKLSGLLPICANCKKIKDDQGYWNQIETYIEKRTEAQFSHGICPDCTEKLYGDQDWYKNGSDKNA